MKITLKNFRCYEDESFDFGEKGITLLSGSSGLGKSSLFMAINFALFGTGTKITMYGKKSCSVILEIGKLIIERSKCPNRLIINDIYEDDIAQDIINRKFGNTFNVSGYISQNGIGSFILMSPADKLIFLEKFAFKDVNLEEIKKCNKELTKERYEKMISTISKLEITQKEFENLTKPIEVAFPIKFSTSTGQERAIQNEETRYKNCNTRISKTQKELRKLQNEISNVKVSENTISITNENINILTEKITENKIQYKNIETKFIGDTQLNSMKINLQTIISQKEKYDLEMKYNENNKKLNDMRDKEIKSLNEKIKNIEDNLWIEFPKNEINEIIKENKLCLDSLMRIKQLNKELNDCTDTSEKALKEKELLEITEKIKLLKQLSTSYSCPSCKSILCLQDNGLHIIDKLPEKNEDIKDLKLIQKKLEKDVFDIKTQINKKNSIQKELENIKVEFEDVSTIENIEEDINYIQAYKIEHQNLELQLTKMKKKMIDESFSSSYIDFKKNVEIDKIRLDELTNIEITFKEEITEEDLRININTQNNYKEKLIDINNTILILEKDINKQKIKLQTIENSFSRNSTEIQLIIIDEDQKIIELQKQLEIHQNNLKIINEYKKYKDELNNYNSWQRKVNDLVTQEKEDRHKYACSTLLKEKILEAESIAMANIISSINTHAQIYLDSFFTDNSICIKLLSFKETKKNIKPQINIQIEYKGMECDINMLSGGEQDRLVLAFTLALAEMFNTPLLLLDESTKSLDQDLTSIVFNSIRENFKGELILVIAHQVITGVFDKIIKLD